ncbi:phosphoribosylformylglycinamidine cyclo-ligase [Syntrophotalea carbinolica DSM 2380]|uniref:Phosphoribosylformylglycinamidine cyclo-ligase n=2 Tax=Syntrophotalea carbinolica TaxID=19 RepID=PUR5_SYNC1|nr:phosphoribosylformylglycinamidine cyclo-ligase [Syntrophotalea carbinolica]Q3A515.1 RecName: Full=Phosphoribosylformylglycinamidine cyclo-ligase; AltName: Full=AIR synthase; AltName: Full=AIRS; AltName: Full=Phosphoribosyl-aminoimidazole synthetase [Syntrophotalea carbinolica DSM 2380]ABA88542.1 phosphoribosylformylglycinamidine cyclo-ligase [Syntrophotalea carbinolica DSM 2380]
MSDQKKMTYKDAGVDIDAGNRFVQLIKPLVKATSRPEVLTDIGGFGGLFSLHADKYKKPTLVASTDGVGTKLKLAFMMDKHDTVGIDLVAMCVNDIVVQGAEPLFFLDYMATGKLTPEKAQDVVKGISEGCIQAGCALIGGETAEMPGFYGEGEYDLAGFTVGIVDNTSIIDGSGITVGDRLIGLASSGLHSNGYSLARKVLFEHLGLNADSKVEELDLSVGEELLKPTRIYVKTILNLLRDFQIKGMAHITGGGLVENVPRMMPKNCQAIIHKDSWPKPPIFELLRKAGNIEEEEMYRTLNYGIGMVLVVPETEAEEIMVRLSGLKEDAFIIGEIAKSAEEGEPTVTLI